MCGLAGYIGTSPNIDKLRILALYNKTRGTDGFGIVVNDERHVFIGKEGDSKEYLEANYFPVNEITGKIVLMHTRQASVGLKTLENTHPFKYVTAENKLLGFFSMNGTVSNYNEMLKTRNITATFTNDSNALGFMMFYDLLEPKIMKEYIGGGAFAFYSVHENKLRLWKGAAGGTEERPLFYMITDKGIYYSSLKDSLLFIRENKEHEIVTVPNNTLLVFNETGIEESITIARDASLSTHARSNHYPNHRPHISNTTSNVSKIRSVQDIFINELLILGEQTEHDVVKILDRFYYKKDLAHGVIFRNSKNELLKFKHNEILKDTVTTNSYNVSSNYEYFKPGFSVSTYCNTLQSLLISKGAKIDTLGIYIYGFKFNTIESFKIFLDKISDHPQFEAFTVESHTSKIGKFFTGFYIPNYIIKRGFTGDMYNSSVISIMNNDQTIDSFSPRSIGNLIVKTNKVNADFRITSIENIKNLPISKTSPLKLNLVFTSTVETMSFDKIGKDLFKVEAIVKGLKNKQNSKTRKQFIENVSNQIIRKFGLLSSILNDKAVTIDHPLFKEPIEFSQISYINCTATKTISGNKPDANKKELIFTAAILNMLLHEKYILCYNKEEDKKVNYLTPGFLFNGIIVNSNVSLNNKYEVELNSILNAIDSDFITSGADEARISKMFSIHLTILYTINRSMYMENVKMIHDLRQRLFGLSADNSFYDHFKKKKSFNNKDFNLDFVEFDPNSEDDIDSPFSIGHLQPLICGDLKNFLTTTKRNFQDINVDLTNMSSIRTSYDFYSISLNKKSAPLSNYELFVMGLSLPVNTFFTVRDSSLKEYVISDGYNISDADISSIDNLDEVIPPDADICVCLKYTTIDKNTLETKLIPIQDWSTNKVEINVDVNDYYQIYEWKWEHALDNHSNLYELQLFIQKVRKVLSLVMSDIVRVTIKVDDSYNTIKPIHINQKDLYDIDAVLSISQSRAINHSFIRFKKNPFKLHAITKEQKSLSLI